VADSVANYYSVVFGTPIATRIQKRDAQGKWSVIAADASATALAADATGNLYKAEFRGGTFSFTRIQKRDAQGNWSMLTASYGNTAGQTVGPTALGVDRAGNLYVADYDGNGQDRIQRRDAPGDRSVVFTPYAHAPPLD